MRGRGSELWLEVGVELFKHLPLCISVLDSRSPLLAS